MYKKTAAPRSDDSSSQTHSEAESPLAFFCQKEATARG